MQLYEKHRPQTLAEVIGQAQAVQSLKTIMAQPGWDRDAIWIQGPSGTGKTTLAKILSGVCSDPFDVEQINGVDCTVDAVRELIDRFQYCSRGESGWRAAIVDEAHAMTDRAVQSMLTFLEKLGKKRLIVFTSTEEISCDLFGNFSKPMARRCKVITLDEDKDAFAAKALEIAKAEGLDGRPLAEFRKLIDECDGSLGWALQRIEAGEMKAPFGQRRPVAPAAPANDLALTIARMNAELRRLQSA